ncbi:MAG TPA: S41 family peptidase [Vicinamibacterales bacterium]|nr:S41 family peptidase [Vicinamibacterales bacterium]
MIRIASSLLLALLSLSDPQSPPPLLHASEWTLDGPRPAAYVLQADGRATDQNGATISLRSAADASGAFGPVSSRLTADSFRGRRVTISGELQTRGAADGASLWLRIDQDATALLLDNGTDQAVRGDAEWTARSISLPVPLEATVVVFGVLLRGGGAVSVRRLRLEVSAPVAASAPLAAPAKDVLDAALSITKKHSLRRNDVPWDVVEPKVRALAAGAEKSADVYPAIRYLLAQLGDHHSFLMPPAQTSQFRTGGAQNPGPEVRALPERAGYVSVPGYSGAEPGAMRAYATRMHEALGGTIASVSCGWVVDLRKDTGGNMWPMLAGLKPFLGTVGLGTFESAEGSSAPWIAGQGVDIEPPPALAVLESSWVAVLTGPRTASSGEAVAIAFRGRPRTRSFGQPTAGLSTANGTFPLPDGAMILLTTAVDADRTGRRYGDKIAPDEPVDAAGTDDTTLSAALQWLKQSSGCGKD